jgi:LDH2 family malate/lactate/ureidoglycolate dehydrogenase
MIQVQAGALEADLAAIFSGLGASDPAAAEIARSLAAAHAAGHPSHGVQLAGVWAEYAQEGLMDLQAEPEITADLGAVVRADARQAPGPVASNWAVRELVGRTPRHGIAAILVRNANHLGRLGECTELLAREGLIALLFTNAQGSGQRIAPSGGTDRRLTNNPISMAIPDGEEPVVLDMSLSAFAEGKIALAQASGEALPPGAILDRDAVPSTDPADYFDGGLLVPAGGHKGVGLIVVVDLLVGILAGTGVCTAANDEAPFLNAFVLIAVDPQPFAQAEEISAQVSALRAHLQASPLDSGAAAVRLPGQQAKSSSADGATSPLEVPASTIDELRKLADAAEVRLTCITEN